jgi:uncharacterized protein
MAESTIAQKLDGLLKLQTIDSEMDSIRKIRGDLPEEVRDLEDEIVGYQTRIAKYQGDLDILDEELNKHKNNRKEAEKLIVKYKDQQMNVRNNREYDAISKEIELQELEMELSDKRLRETDLKITLKKDEIVVTESTYNERQKDLDSKKKELEVLVGESEDDESKLLVQREKALKNVDERLLKSYQKVRNNASNGLAIVTVKRGACGGCFNLVPPQRQADIKEKKKIIVCEHCGRILADVEDAVVTSSKK